MESDLGDEPGLSLWDTLEEGFEAEVSSVDDKKQLTPANMDLVRAFALKMQEHLTDHVFNLLQFTFPSVSELQLVKAAKHH
ncbi:hypothetical protein AcV5_003042 [Taiwanofungus camphoratus]|nr:hypothetical protein AcV5_003042 [Antrodia cinnamomea]